MGHTNGTGLISSRTLMPRVPPDLDPGSGRHTQPIATEVTFAYRVPRTANPSRHLPFPHILFSLLYLPTRPRFASGARGPVSAYRPLPNSPPAAVPLPVSPAPISPSTPVQNSFPSKSTHRSTRPLRTHEHAPISRISEDQRSPLVRSVVRPPQFRTPRLCQVLRYDRSPLRNHPLTHPGVFKKPLDFSSSPGNIVSVYACITPNQSLPFQTREIITPQVSQKYPKTSRNNANNANNVNNSDRATRRIHHIRKCSPATPRYWQNPLPVDQLASPQGFYCLRRCFSDSSPRTVPNIHQTPCRPST